MPGTPFFYLICQVGAETPLKTALCQPAGPFRLAFSRPGFVTLKSEYALPLWTKALPTHPLIRSSGQALKRINAATAADLTEILVHEISTGNIEFDALHIWHRDTQLPGSHDFEPGISPEAATMADAIQHRLAEHPTLQAVSVNAPAPAGSRVLDLIRIDGDQWWLGLHRVTSIESGWVGGAYAFAPPPTMISRAYLKIAEAIAWSQFPVEIGDEVVEIGCSPGGACQRLLDLGLKVTGIDPAEVDNRLIGHPRFRFIRARSRDLKRKFFSRFRWLVCDANVAPNYTLDTVESIVTHPSNRVEGMLLTIKLNAWKHVDDIPIVLNRIQSWGFPVPRARQLAFNRREYCIAALRGKR